MPSVTETTWTCSRCNGTQTIAFSDPARYPIGWRTCITHPLGDPTTGGGRIVWDLCTDCRHIVERCLNGADLFPPEGIQVVWPSGPPVPEARMCRQTTFHDGRTFVCRRLEGHTGRHESGTAEAGTEHTWETP